VTYKDFGSIDSSLRYRPPDASSSKRVVRYELILKLTGNSQLEGAGGRQWRIESPQRNICVALDAAIAHVTAARDKTTDPKVNKNAQITLAQLRKFQR
jgi:hypothetical protein